MSDQEEYLDNSEAAKQDAVPVSQASGKSRMPLIDFLRMDFEIKVLSRDETTGQVRFALIPDSRRYEWRERDGGRWLLDRLENMQISEEAFVEMVESIVGMPIFRTPQMLGNAVEYVLSRQAHIRAALEGGEFNEGDSCDRSEEFLEALGVDRTEFVIASVDLVGSTKLATEVEPELYTRIIKVLLFELSHIVPDFHGFVLKYTGDGLIIYYTMPRIMVKHDHALDSASVMLRLVREGMNPILAELGYPKVDLRIGLETGEASVLILGSDRAKRHRDIIGAVVNLATKIQGIAKPGEVSMGRRYVQGLHTKYRLMLEEVVLPDTWPFKDSDNEPYRVFRRPA